MLPEAHLAQTGIPALMALDLRLAVHPNGNLSGNRSSLAGMSRSSSLPVMTSPLSVMAQKAAQYQQPRTVWTVYTHRVQHEPDVVPIRQRYRLHEAPWCSGAVFELRAAEACRAFHISNGNIRAMRRRSPDPKQRMLRCAPAHRGRAIRDHAAAAATRDGRLKLSHRHRPLGGM